MLTIDVITPFNFSEIVGPVGTVKRILDNREYFLSQNCDITVINKRRALKQWTPSKESNVNNHGNWKHKLKIKLDSMAINNRLLSIILVELKFLQRKKIVDDYLKMNRTPDIICFHSEIPCYFFLKKRKNTQSKVVLFFHNDGIPYQMLRLYYPKLEGSWYLKSLMKRYEYTVNNADRCVFICRKGMININNSFPTSVEKSSLVINGIDDLKSTELAYIENVKRERELDNVVKLCCVGSVSIRKGQRKLIETLGKLDKKQRMHYQLTIVGNGSDLNYCKTLVNNMHLEDVVNFTGAVDNKEVYKYLATADVFVLLSMNEGMPISIIEAMRAGLAILSTNVSGIPELVSEENGLLIEPTSEALYNVLLRGDDYNWKAMGEKSRDRYLEMFTFERMRLDYVKMIYNTIGLK